MLIALQIITAVALLVIVFSDFREYMISVVWLAVFALSNITAGFVELGIRPAGINLLLNMAQLILLYTFLWGYVKFLRVNKYRSLRNAIGLGDLLFIPALTPLFTPVDFMLFLIVSFVLSLAFWGVMGIVTKKRSAIPLVGTVGCCYLAFRIYEMTL